MAPRKARRLILIAAIILGVCGLAALCWRGAPWRYEVYECAFCGRVRCETERLGVGVRVEEHQTGESEWVASIHPEHAEHHWVRVCVQRRRKWFGDVEAGDGIARVCLIYRQRATQGEEKARQLLKEYHALLTGDPTEFDKFTIELVRMSQSLHPPQ